MIRIKTFNEIVYNIINNIHDKLSEVDTKPGTFLRDIMINPVANEISDIYDDMYNMQLAQSVLTATGEDLDKLALNFFLKRKKGQKSSGKIRLYIKGTEMPVDREEKRNDIFVPAGRILSTEGSMDKPSIKFKTKDDLLVPGEIINSLPKDSNGYRYVEILCESLDIGSKTNVGPYTIIGDPGDFSSDFIEITNPFSFNGGEDPEDDVSLAFRISLAITGSNIGTKKGYLSYILQQPEVIDALIVGAQDDFMTRDIVKVYDDRTGQIIEQHAGGKVDIYVRTNTIAKEKFEYEVTHADLDNDYLSPQHITFPKNAYPIEKVTSIVGKVIYDENKIKYKNYVNADNYELERTLNKNIERYYTDILWDFNIKNFFPDQEFNKFPEDIAIDEIIRLKTKLDNELLRVEKYLQNISYKIDWDVMDWETIKIDGVELLQLGKYTDGLYYKARTITTSDDGVVLGVREFIKKQDKLYIRVFIEPDFKLVRENDDFAGSVRSLDYIRWFQHAKNMPEVKELLEIQYIYNSGIRKLQHDIENKRVMTADVLIKSTIKKDVEIALNAKCSTVYNPINIKQDINNALADYVNNRKKIGDYLDESDIVYIAKSIDGVISVDIDSVKMNLINFPQSAIIKCNPNEYFNLKNTLINVSNTPLI